MADWDTTNPEDSDIVSQYPANERAARDAVRTNFGVDHHEANDANVGKHEVVQVLDNAADPTIAAGEVGIWNNGGVAFMREGAGTPRRLDVIPSGTVMMFYQSTPPTGWTDTGGGSTDSVFSLVSVGSGLGGTNTADTWTITGITVANHTLTTSQIPSHNHSMNLNGSHDHGGSTGSAGAHAHALDTGRGGGGVGDRADRDAASNFLRSPGDGTGAVKSVGSHNHGITSDGQHAHTINNTGGGTAHNHGASQNGGWRPPRNFVIRASKD